MSYRFGNAERLLTALEHPRPAELTPIEHNSLPEVTIDFDLLARQVYAGLDQFAALIGQSIPLTLDGQHFDTSNYYHHAGSQMMIFSLKSADAIAPLPTSAISSLGILEMYKFTDLSEQDLTKVILEKRPSEKGPIIEALIKSHHETPTTITEKVPGSVRVIAHPEGDPTHNDTTLKITPSIGESTDSFTERINQAIETTAAGIIAQTTSQTRQARQNLIAA